MDDMTAEEKKIVDELRRRTINDVTPKMLEDVSLFYRFAKARDFNLGEAEAMLRKNIAWRKEMQIDTILTDYEPPEVLVKYAPTSFICFDKEGSVVRHIDCGRTDAKNLFKAVTKEELGMYYAYTVEKDRDRFIKTGKNVKIPLYTAVYDLECLTYANAMSIKNLQYMTSILKIFLDNYPESIRFLIAINAPVYFTWFYSAIKPIIPKAVLQKVRIYGTDGWKEDFLELIEAAELPAVFGGTKTDPDGNPLCETLILRGRPLPESYCVNSRSKKFAFNSDAVKLTVKPFSKEEIDFRVTEENSCLEFEFEVKNRDIDFSLLFKSDSSDSLEPAEIFLKQRIDANDETEKVGYNCEKTGTYTMVFDNTYSWLHSKEVYYRAEIKDPRNGEIYN